MLPNVLCPQQVVQCTLESKGQIKTIACWLTEQAVKESLVYKLGRMGLNTHAHMYTHLTHTHTPDEQHMLNREHLIQCPRLQPWLRQSVQVCTTLAHFVDSVAGPYALLHSVCIPGMVGHCARLV